ncbi:MAG: transposon-encoded TnpW family protein [Eubacteriales bacterium]
MFNNKNIENTEKDKAILKYTIGNTTYNVSLYFSESSNENMEDKIKRLIVNEQLE